MSFSIWPERPSDLHSPLLADISPYRVSVLPTNLEIDISDSVSEERIAIRSGNLDLVKNLVSGDSVINEANANGWTLLHEAATSDHRVDIARFLVSAGAVIDFGVREGVTPLYIACKLGCEVMARYLVEEAGCDVNAPALDIVPDTGKCVSFTPLHIACNQGRAAIVKLLLDNKANVNAADSRGLAPVHFAVNHSYTSIVHMLIEAGADLTIRDSQNYTPLHHACILGNLEIMDILLEKLGRGKEIIDQTTNGNWTLLMLACFSHQRLIAERLIELGADTTVVTGYGVLALHLAASGDVQLLKLLLHHTPNDVVENYSTFQIDPVYFRSLPCILIDYRALESLEFLYQSGVNQAVLECPTRVRHHLMSPIVHLILFSEPWSDDEVKLKFLEFLLSYDFLIEPVYSREAVPYRVMTVFEAIVLTHSASHQGCSCEGYISLILEKVEFPWRCLPGSETQVYMFRKAAHDGFVAALGLLNYTPELDPDDVMELYLEDILERKHQWNNREPSVIKFFVEKCFTDFSSKISQIKNTLNMFFDEEMEALREFVFAYNEARTNLTVPSLKRRCRFLVRRQIRLQAKDNSESFESNVRELRLPYSIFKYIVYDTYV